MPTVCPVGRLRDGAALPKKGAFVLPVQLPRNFAHVPSLEHPRDGVAYASKPHEALFFHSLCEPVEVVARERRFRRALQVGQPDERSVGAPHRELNEPPRPVVHAALPLHEVHERQPLIRHSQQHEQAAVVYHHWHRTVG